MADQGTGPAAPVIDSGKLERFFEKARESQRLVNGLLAGSAGAAIGAAVWAVLTVLTGYQIGWMAVGVGFLVGYAVRTFGKGVDKVFGISGAVIALLGCVAGNYLTVLIMVSRQESIALLDLLGQTTPALFAAVLKDTFQPMDVLFYAIAVYEGYRLSFRRFTDEELAPLAG
jgi:hypothetical protein